tara:strand:- start:2246 stop:2767 length:522 start_codon:yes stop_codon:yes gene_type:complete
VWIKKQTSKKRIIEMAPACSCDACNHACQFSSGIMTKNDVDRLAKHLHMTKQDVKDKHLEKVHIYNKIFHRPKLERKDNKPFGKCTFFQDKVGCKIHSAKPLHCKIAMNCKDYGEQLNTWFYLNHIVDGNDPEAIRQWAVYLKTHPTIPGGTLKDLVPNQAHLKKILNYEILK